jgi:hypothetical protein
MKTYSKWTATYNPTADEWAVFGDGNIFCHVSDYDFAIFLLSFRHSIRYECPWTGKVMNE